MLLNQLCGIGNSVPRRPRGWEACSAGVCQRTFLTSNMQHVLNKDHIKDRWGIMYQSVQRLDRWLSG